MISGANLPVAEIIALQPMRTLELPVAVLPSLAVSVLVVMTGVSITGYLLEVDVHTEVIQ